MKIYGISGLGADSRVYRYMCLDFKFIPIDWIEPIKNETISNYSRRLSLVINTTERFCLIGVSFGGLVALEVSKILNPDLTILISSVETKHEIRYGFRLFGKTKLINILPIKLFNPPRWVAKFLFGTKRTELLNDILDDTDLKFTKWAIRELINWKNEVKVENVIKINGTKDKLIPPRGKRPTELIKGGEHFMIVDRADEISKIINTKINELQRMIP